MATHAVIYSVWLHPSYLSPVSTNSGEPNTSHLPNLGHKLHGQWIKAHQDDDTSYEDLNCNARLNIDSDHLATWYQDHPTLPHLFTCFQSQGLRYRLFISVKRPPQPPNILQQPYSTMDLPNGLPPQIEPITISKNKQRPYILNSKPLSTKPSMINSKSMG